jgi:hypothetical protein
MRSPWPASIPVLLASLITAYVAKRLDPLVEFRQSKHVVFGGPARPKCCPSFQLMAATKLPSVQAKEVSQNSHHV